MSKEIAPKVEVPDRVLNRFNQSAYEQFEKLTRGVLPMVAKTELEAGFTLGIEHALRMLRNGFVINA